jgi:uncharacterized protein (UPF0261 family)
LKTIAIIGTMDSKGTEYGFINDILKGLGLNTLLIHCGVFAPTIRVDVSNEEVFKAADADLAAIVAKKDRASATEAAARGVEKLVPRLYAEGKFDGIISLGGSGGTSLATPGIAPYRLVYRKSWYQPWHPAMYPNMSGPVTSS